MRALSFKQPFASLMLKGKIETRTWSTKYRGAVLICASKKGYTCAEVDIICGRCKIDEVLRSQDLLKGKAIAVGELVDCRPMTKEDEDACYVKYQEGLFCHVYKYVVEIEPFDWKGSQGWKTLTQGQIKQITFKKPHLFNGF